MRMWITLWALFFCILPALPVGAEEKGATLDERVEKLEKALEEFKEHERRERGPMEPFKEGETPGQPGIGPLPDVAKDLRREQQAPLSFSSTGSGRLVYAKPFVAAPKAIVGGYMDFFYTNYRKNYLANGAGPSNPGIGATNSSFDSQRYVPFIYADVTDHVKVATELEIEHGIRESSANGKEVEFSLEFATIDYLIKEPINLRGGILLLPVGKFNLLHDSPLNDVGPRPLVDQFIIPTTLSETGAGIYGTFYPGRTSKMDYELYVTTGFNGYSSAGAPVYSEANGVAAARQRANFATDGLDNNNGKSVVGRVAFSPVLGVEIAGSQYYGSYDPNSKRSLSITALDWTLQRGPWELIGEAAWTYAKDASKCLPQAPSLSGSITCVNGFAVDSTTGRLIPQRSNGYYVQTNYHFMPDWLTQWAPKHFGPGSTFTAALRWDKVNTNLDAPGGLGDLEKLTAALNFRPIEDCVFRFAYEFNMRAINPVTSRSVTGGNAVILSAATYF